MKRAHCIAHLAGLAAAVLVSTQAAAAEVPQGQALGPTADKSTLRNCLPNEALARLTRYEERPVSGGGAIIHAEMVDAHTGQPLEPIEVDKSPLNEAYARWLNRPKGTLLCRPLPDPPPAG